MLDLTGLAPESWCCVDCGINTAPGLANRIELEKAFAARALTGKAGVDNYIDEHSEVYTVRDSVWEASGLEAMGGCLCIGCLEKRLGRKLKPKDFPRNDPLNIPQLPGTPRLLQRRGGP